MSPPGFDLLAPGSAATAILVGSRVSGLFLVAPIFSGKNVPMKLRAGLILLFTILLQPVARASAGVPVLTPATMLSETLIGFAIGFGAAVLVGAAATAGDFMAVQSGLAGAASLDPITMQSSPTLSQFTQLLAITLLLVSNGHLLMIEALAGTLHAMPVGRLVDMQAGLGVMVGLASHLFVLGIQLAAPVLATVFIATMALGMLGRAAPQLQVLSVAFQIQIGVTFIALAAAIPVLATFFAGWTGVYESLLTPILGAMGAGGG